MKNFDYFYIINLKNKVKEFYTKWQKYKEHAEQHEFIRIFMQDQLIEKGYKELQANWDEDHAKTFINGVNKFLN